MENSIGWPAVRHVGWRIAGGSARCRADSMARGTKFGIKFQLFQEPSAVVVQSKTAPPEDPTGCSITRGSPDGVAMSVWVAGSVGVSDQHVRTYEPLNGFPPALVIGVRIGWEGSFTTAVDPGAGDE